MTHGDQGIPRTELDSEKALVEALFSDSRNELSSNAFPKVYKFHTNVSQINFQSQQKSAIALALHIKHLIDGATALEGVDRRIRVAIAGGGIAGVTLATMLLIETSCEITLFEKENDVLSHLAIADHRYIHPGINCWPRNQTNGNSILPHTTELPVLNWHADSCSNVIRKIYRQYESVVNKYGITKDGKVRISIEPRTEYQGYRIDERSEKVEVSVNPDKTSAHWLATKYDILVISTGFGDERRAVDDSSPRYWEPPMPLSTKECPLGTHPVHIICGSGDGGLIDFILAAYSCSMKDLICVAEKITRSVKEKYGEGFESALYNLTNTQEIIEKIGLNEIVRMLEELGARKNEMGIQEVVLVTTSHEMRDSGKSALIHRVLAYAAAANRRAVNGNIIKIYYKSRLARKSQKKGTPPTYFIEEVDVSDDTKRRRQIAISTNAIRITERIGQEVERSPGRDALLERFLNHTRNSISQYSFSLNKEIRCGDMRFLELKKLANEAVTAWNMHRGNSGANFFFNLIAESEGPDTPCQNVYFELVRYQSAGRCSTADDFLLFNKRIFGFDIVDAESDDLEILDGR